MVHYTLLGLLQVGDRIVEVNGEMVDSMSPADLQAMLVRCVIFIHQLLDVKNIFLIETQLWFCCDKSGTWLQGNSRIN